MLAEIISIHSKWIKQIELISTANVFGFTQTVLNGESRQCQKSLDLTELKDLTREYLKVKDPYMSCDVKDW